MSAGSGDTPDAQRARFGVVIRALILIDQELPAAELDRLRAGLAELVGDEPRSVRLWTGDEASLTTLASSISSQGRLWTEGATRPGAPAPPVMSAAPVAFAPDGRPDWSAMWTGFCDLALHGGPPHRGPDNPVRGWLAVDSVQTGQDAGPGAPVYPVAEIQAGILATTGMSAERAAGGWLSLTCDSPRMAAWMCAAIVLENVDARSTAEQLFVPAQPGFVLEDQVKSVITVVAKVHHYWQAHVAASTRANLDAPPDAEVPALARQYRELLGAWGEARTRRDAVAAGKLHMEMHVLTGQLSLTMAGRAALEAYLLDPDPWVRLWSASEGYSWAPEARGVLEEIRGKGSMASVDAAWALLQLEAGRRP